MRSKVSLKTDTKIQQKKRAIKIKRALEWLHCKDEIEEKIKLKCK